MQLFQDPVHSAILLELKPEPAQLELGLEPQTLVVCLCQRCQGEVVEVLQELHVCGLGDKVQEAVDLLLTLIACHSSLCVTQHLTAQLCQSEPESGSGSYS